jgi:hypothetical protein
VSVRLSFSALIWAVLAFGVASGTGEREEERGTGEREEERPLGIGETLRLRLLEDMVAVLEREKSYSAWGWG